MNKASGWRLGRHQFLMVCFGWLLCAHLLAADVASPVPGSHVLVVVTNLLQMHQLLNSERRVTCALHLNGVVCYARPEENAFVLGDDSGAELLYLDWLGNSIKPGQRLLVEGTNCWVVRRDLGVTIDRPPLIDNNGVHGMYEKSGTMHLDAGRHPIRLAWFNGTGVFGLKLECQGPGLPRQPVSDAWLFRAVVDPASGQSRYVHGLDFRCNEGGWWNALPDFDSGNRVKSGVTSNFDLAVRSRDEFVALDFSGYLQVPTDGTYSFYLASDDGSEFFIGKPSHDLKVLGFDSIPKPKPVAIGQLLRPEDDSQWSEIEGMVSFATESQGRMELELKTESGHIRIQIMDFTGFSPTLLLNSRIRVVGVCQSVVTLDGRKIPGTLLVPSWLQVQPMELAPMLWNRYPVQRISSLAEMRPDENGERIAHVQGKVCGAGPGQIRVRDESGSATISITQPQPKPEGLLDILGLVNGEGTNLLINSGCYRETGKPFNTKAGSLPVLTTASQVKELSREDASLGYPVLIRGVVIGLMSGSPSIVIQDATSGIFVRIPEMGRPDPPEIGELWQIEGVTTAGDFAPTLLAQKVTRLDRGRLPEPMRPTWDQLINGSADTQYAEIQGIVTDIQTNTLVLLCRGGKMWVNFPEMDETSLRLYVNKLVRIRGCLLAIWNVETHQVNAGEIQMSNPTISVDVPNSVDLFASTPLKHVADLLRFDLRASAFQPVKVSGQFVRREGKEYYLLDGATGLRFVPKIIPEIQPGECLEVVGLPELGGPSPILHEAQVRKTGMAALPPAIPLQPQELN